MYANIEGLREGRHWIAPKVYKSSSISVHVTYSHVIVLIGWIRELSR